MEVKLIVATDFNRCIGNAGALPWHSPEDLKWFSQHTRGYSNNAVIMGRKTWDSIPDKFKPLKDRKNIVVSRGGRHILDIKQKYPDIEVVNSIGLAAVKAQEFDVAWIIGGYCIYQAALEADVVDEIYLTLFEGVFEGDTYFPDIPVHDWSFEQLQRGEDHIRYRIIRLWQS